MLFSTMPFMIVIILYRLKNISSRTYYMHPNIICVQLVHMRDCLILSKFFEWPVLKTCKMIVVPYQYDIFPQRNVYRNIIGYIWPVV